MKTNKNVIPRNFKRIITRANTKTNVNEIGDILEIVHDDGMRSGTGYLGLNTRTGQTFQALLCWLRIPELHTILSIEKQGVK